MFTLCSPGRQLDSGRVMSNLIAQALRGSPLALYGGGARTRALRFAAELIAARCRVMAVAGPAEGPVTPGNRGQLTGRSPARRIRALTGARSAPVARPVPQDAPRRRRPDIARAPAGRRARPRRPRRMRGWPPPWPISRIVSGGALPAAARGGGP